MDVSTMMTCNSPLSNEMKLKTGSGTKIMAVGVP